MKKTLFVALAILFAYPLAVAQSQEKNQAGARDGAKVEVPMTIRSSHLIGMRVRNKENKDVGSIDDVVVSLGSGKIRYAALSFGGFAGLGNKLFAVPWEALTFKFGEKDHYLLFDVNEDDLKNAPGFDKNNWPNFGDSSFTTSVDKHYKTERSADQTARATNVTQPQGNVAVDDAYRVSTLKNMDVRDASNRDIGNVSELVFNLKDGTISYAALSFGSIAGLGGKLFALPFHAFKVNHTANDRYLVLNVSEEKLRAAPGFDSNHWPNTADPNWSREIDQYYGGGVAQRPADNKQ